MTAMQALKSATSAWHERLEEIVNSKHILDPSLTQKEFKALMRGHYQLHWHVEPIITDIFELSLPELQYAQERQKLDFLTKDLIDLEIDPASLQIKNPDWKIESLYEALGASYVLEGSTLGGQVIRRALQKHPELSTQSQFHYYNCYGEHLRTRWISFMEMVDQKLQTPTSIEIACRSACQTFELACDVFSTSFNTLVDQQKSKEVLV